MPPANGPLERRYDVFLIQQFTPPTRKGPFFYSVIARLPRGRGSGAGDERAPRDQPRAVPDLEVVVPGRQGDVEHGGSEDEPRWRRRHAGRARAGRRRTGVVDRLHERLESPDRARDQPTAELAVRAALGASRGRVLAIPARRERGARRRRGGARRRRGVGRHALLQTQGAAYFPRTQEIRFDAPWSGSWPALAISSALIFGLVPALHATGGSTRCLAAIRPHLTGGIGARRLRRGLVGGAVRDRDAAAGRRGVAAHEPRSPAARRSGLRRRTSADRVDPVAGRAIRRQRARHSGMS